MLTTELIEYKDDLVYFKYPKGLRQKPFKNLTHRAYYFVRPKPRNHPRLFESLLIEIDPPKGFIDTVKQCIRMPTPPLIRNETLQQEILRRGKSDVLPRAIEVAMVSRDLRRNVVEYSWGVVFPYGGHIIEVGILSTGDFEKSRPHWVEVIRSIHFVGKKRAKKRQIRCKE